MLAFVIIIVNLLNLLLLLLICLFLRFWGFVQFFVCVLFWFLIGSLYLGCSGTPDVHQSSLDLRGLPASVSWVLKVLRPVPPQKALCDVCGCLPTCVSVYHVYAWCQWRPEEDTEFPKTGVTVGCKPSHECWEELLTTEPIFKHTLSPLCLVLKSFFAEDITP